MQKRLDSLIFFLKKRWEKDKKRRFRQIKYIKLKTINTKAMLVKLRKITSKSEALVASSTLLHSDKKLTFSKDEGMSFRIIYKRFNFMIYRRSGRFCHTSRRINHFWIQCNLCLLEWTQN